MTYKPLVIKTYVNVAGYADTYLVAFPYNVAEKIALHIGIRNADFSRIIRVSYIAAGKHIDVFYVCVFKLFCKFFGAEIFTEIIYAGHSMKVKMYRAFNRFQHCSTSYSVNLSVEKFFCLISWLTGQIYPKFTESCRINL